MTSLENMQAFVEFAKDKFGHIDVIVNNTGLMPLSKLEVLKIDEWNRMINVNIRGVLHGIAVALPTFKQQHSGQFVNLFLIGGHAVYPTATVYCATKYAVWAISEGLRQESTAIRVTTISPGTALPNLNCSAQSPMLKRRSGSQIPRTSYPGGRDRPGDLVCDQAVRRCGC
ncbi:Short-chain dehydrogenase/reductase SDR [uncultured Synechococcales cyanobacterium]|uniref:Short-chain dehydrogenase/reductase SDR n=1 Tax=uncultured Synechococcales cyanobacterium TaxID=1936017 RepID=A0A6J4UPZ0_9CYAN|nr:Short-chain dehydrogenase/reductase SDR [uncultured Synechococcales cyanobacterium]